MGRCCVRKGPRILLVIVCRHLAGDDEHRGGGMGMAPAAMAHALEDEHVVNA